MTKWKSLDQGSDLFPSILPPHWEETDRAIDGVSYMSLHGLVVICSASVERDGKHWLHVSCSRAHRVPTYRDLVEVKTLFIGDARKAIQVFPPKNEHINVHPYCLHLWCCLDEDPLPDFRKLGTL